MVLRCRAAVIASVIAALAAPVRADPRGDILAKTRAAMASYDAMDYEAARRLLNQALAIAKRSKLDRDPIVARVYLDLGIAQLATSDPEAAKVSFLSAVQIDSRITVEPAYKSSEIVRMLDDARAVAGDSEPASEDCKLRGLQHAAVRGARRGIAQQIDVVVGGDLSPARVIAMYRPEGAIDFTELRLARQGGCRYAGVIPAAAMRGGFVHYYIAVYDMSNRVLAARGSSAAPNLLALGTARAAVREPGEPARASPPAPTAPRARAEVVQRATAARRGPRILAAMSIGTGAGYVSGRTEGENTVQKCCLGLSPLVFGGELRYQLEAGWSFGAAARLGLPLGANITGHSTIAPAGFARIGYAGSGAGNGLHAMAEVGFGILRNTIKLTANAAGMDTDIVAQGPVLVGAGIGYHWWIASRAAMTLDIDGIAGIAVVDQLGTAIHLNTGVGADMRLGFAVGF